MALATVAERLMISFNAQGLANTAWAFATVKRPHEELFTSSATAAERQVSEFNPQGLATMARGVGTVY